MFQVNLWTPKNDSSKANGRRINGTEAIRWFTRTRKGIDSFIVTVSNRDTKVNRIAKEIMSVTKEPWNWRTLWSHFYWNTVNVRTSSTPDRLAFVAVQFEISACQMHCVARKTNEHVFFCSLSTSRCCAASETGDQSWSETFGSLVTMLQDETMLKLLSSMQLKLCLEFQWYSP